jgi:hypothetical protein
VTSGRYHRGPVEFPEGPTWPALYLALRPEIPWVEITRHGPVLPQHNEFLLSELSVALPGVVDCRDVMAMGLSAGDLLHDTDYGVPHGLAAAALVGGAKGMIVPSATLLGDNLIILPENLPCPATTNSWWSTVVRCGRMLRELSIARRQAVSGPDTPFFLPSWSQDLS